MRILVQVLHVRVGGGTVEVVVALLHVFAMVAFVAVQPEESFFENRIVAIPKGEGETGSLVTVADAGDAVFVPAVGFGAGMVVGEAGPDFVRVVGVVFANSAPGAFGNVRSPAFPMGSAGSGLGESMVLGRERRNS